jgi:hypothetical protein
MGCYMPMESVPVLYSSLLERIKRQNKHVQGTSRTMAPLTCSVIAPRQARRILQGESPCREKDRNGFLQGLATHPYRALDPWRSCCNIGNEQDGLSVGRESCRPQGRPRSLKCWYSFEMQLADAEGFNARRRQHRSIR